MRCIFFLAGCWTAGSLEHSALENQKHAEVEAQLGNGPAAAHASQRAVAEHQAARRKFEKRSSYWWSEVLMR
jgi:hypothetical protein